MKQLALQEAKEYADHLHKQIQRAREKGWQVLLFLLAIDVYLIKQILEAEHRAVYLIMLGIATPFSVYMFRLLRMVVFPTSYISPGARVASLRKEMKNATEPDHLVDALMDSVDLQVTANRTVMQQMIDSYKKSVWALIYMAASLGLFVAVVALSELFIGNG